MVNKIILFSLIIAFISCNEEEVQPRNHCLDEPILVDPNQCNTATFLCRVDRLGIYDLQENSKSFQPFYCKEVGSRIKYVNSAGDTIFMNLFSKWHNRIGTVDYTSIEKCQEDTTKFIAYCFDSESVLVILISDELPIELIIKLEAYPDLYGLDKTKGGDFLYIYRRLSETTFSKDFGAVISKGNLPYSNLPYQEFYPSIELLGKTYTNVMSNGISPLSDPKPKYYYNASIGLIGFVDFDGTLWRIND